MSQAPAVMAPTAPTRRIDTIDILRGLTLFGVLLANMAVFSLSGNITGQGPNYWSDPADKAAQLLVMFLAIGEFYVPFAFFFGWAMAVQMDRAAALGARYLPLYLRRIAVLFVMGLLHAVFLWYGDVLATYAVLGLPLILFQKLSNRVILIVAIICLLVPSILYLPGPTAQIRQDYNQNAAGLYREAGAGAGIYATGAYVEITAQRVKEVKAYWAGILYWGPYIFGLFLLGLYVGRRGLLRHIEDHLPLFRRAFWIGLGVGLPLTVVYVLMRLSPDRAPADWQPFVGRTFRTFGGLGLCTFYLSAIILLTQQESWRERLAFLVPVGRMTLTNYLLQSLICTLIFYGYGLALYDRTGPAIGLILTVIIFAVQARLSAWWLERYRFGPMEWLWRTLVYLRPQPMYPEGDEPPPPRSRVAVLGMVALVLAATVGAGAWWWTHQESGPPQVGIQLPQFQPTPTHTIAPASTPPSPTPIATRSVLWTPAVNPVARNPGPAAAPGNLGALGRAFDEEQAFAAIETLASPQYQGRQAGSPGGRAAGDYVAQRFAAAGLQPAGLDGAYFQPFPVLYTTLADTPELVVTGPTGAAHTYTFRQDFATLVRYYAGAGAGQGQVIWVHNGAHDDYSGVNAVGKVVLCREGATREDQARNALEHGAVGLLLLADTDQRPLDFVGPNRDVWVPAPIPVLRVSPPVAQDLLAGTGLTLDDLTLNFGAVPLSTTARLAVNLRTEAAAEGRNVLGVLPGRDPEYANQIVIVGGHYDHMGQDPSGAYWPGANDDASGVAAIIEIAQSWQEQGYVPRRTVLFAAWDAEEIGLVGSTYYVQHPRYPLTATVGLIQLDMVGAGGDALYIEGSATLNPRLAAIAGTLGISTTTSTAASGSDHVPFAQAGVPASLLIWLGVNPADVPDYHRPSDTPAVIDPAKLAGAGRVTNLGLLALAEGEPALADLLQARAAAVRANDAAAYLSTSSPARQALDRDQFAAVQALHPVRFDLSLSNPLVVGNVATGTVQISLGYVVTANVTATRSAGLAVRFTHTSDHWTWDGPALVWAPVTTTAAGFAVAHPPDRDVGDLGREAASRYITITRQLGLPAHTDAVLMLYPSQQALWVDTVFPEPPAPGDWFDSTGEQTLVKLVAGGPVSTATLTHLALVQAGVTEDMAPWLWRGLPLALAAAPDPLAAQERYLPQLAQGLAPAAGAEPVAVPGDVADWAAVDYLQRRVGWPGLGRLVNALGRGQSADAALARVAGLDSAGLDAAWRAEWASRIQQAQNGLATLLAARQAAVLAGDTVGQQRDEPAFRRTVAAANPTLLAEELAWFASPVEAFELTGELAAILDDGRLLAQVTTRYTQDGRAGSVAQVVQLTPDGSETGYQWAGAPFKSLAGAHVTVYYPAGREALARAVLLDAEAAYAPIAADLGFAPAAPVIKLYDDAAVFRASVRPALPTWVTAWTGPGQALKFVAAALDDPAARRRLVAQQTARWYLAQAGGAPEWLSEGVALVQVGRAGPADARYIAGEFARAVTIAAQRDRLSPLDAMPAFLSLAPADRNLAYAQSWDAARYLADTYGRDRLRAVVQALARGQTVDAVWRSVLGQSLTDFEADWRASAARGHADPAWIDAAWRFDGAAALATVDVLTGTVYAGRAAGSPGEQAAARYIAAEFARYGLTPAGDPDTYLQQAPISYTVLLDSPRLMLLDARGQPLTGLDYRREFVALLNVGGGGAVESELVWVRDADYTGMRLAGKVAVRRLADRTPAQEVQHALAHGAGGLILLSESNEDQLLGKTALSVSAPPTRTLPVLQVGSLGTARLLAAAGYTWSELVNSAPALPLGLRARIDVPLSAPVTAPTANVLGVLPGADPARRNELVIIGAHYDHVGDEPDGARYPGANDDASGVGVLLEIARLYQETGYRPARTILFAAWGAQEPGEVGSSYYVAHPARPLTDTVALIQLDAVGGGFAGFRVEAQGNRQQEAWPLFAVETAAEQVEGRLTVSRPAGRSDQRPFQQAGVPAVLMVWTGASDENRPAGHDDAVTAYNLGVTGRTVALALMMLAQ